MLVLQAWKVASKSVFARLVLLLAVPTTPSRIYMQCADCKQPHASYDRSCAPISSAIWQTSGSGNGPSPRQSLQRKAEAMRGPAMACGQSLPCLHLETMPCYAATDDASGILPASCKHAEALSAPGITSTDLHSTCPSQPDDGFSLRPRLPESHPMAEPAPSRGLNPPLQDTVCHDVSQAQQALRGTSIADFQNAQFFKPSKHITC